MTEPEITPAAGPKAPKPMRERLETNLKRAKKLAGTDDPASVAHANFLLDETRILAVFEVAAALRGDAAADDGSHTTAEG